MPKWFSSNKIICIKVNWVKYALLCHMDAQPMHLKLQSCSNYINCRDMTTQSKKKASKSFTLLKYIFYMIHGGYFYILVSMTCQWQTDMSYFDTSKSQVTCQGPIGKFDSWLLAAGVSNALQISCFLEAKSNIILHT